jgi:hypothetical protein
MAYKKRWFQLASWRNDDRRRARMARRFSAATCLKEHRGTLMNLLGEVVLDLYEEIYALRTKRSREGVVLVEYSIRLEQALNLSDDTEWEQIRQYGLDPIEIAVVACPVCAKHKKGYIDLERIQLDLRKQARPLAIRFAGEVKRQGAAFLYRFG